MNEKQKALEKDPILLDLPSQILGPGFVLKPPQIGEGNHIASAVRETWKDLHEWEDWAKDVSVQGTEEYWEAKTRRAKAQFILRERLQFRIYNIDTKKFVGFVELCQPNWSVRSFILGYWIRQSEQNKGYATKATNALLRYAFGPLEARHVGIGHALGNKASEKVIEKLGFKIIGERPNVLALADNRIVGDRIYYRDSIKNLSDIEVSWT